MFSIGFTDERLVKSEPGEKGRIGLLILDEHEERFIAHTLTWSENQYLEHWTDALQRALEGKPAALVTDLLTPVQSSHLVWWPIWKIGSELVFQNQLLFFKDHHISGTRIIPEELYRLIGQHTSRDSDNNLLSEWRTPASHVQHFLKTRRIVS